MLAADDATPWGACPCEGRRGALWSSHPRPEHKDARWCGRGRAPPSAFEPLGSRRKARRLSPVLARETRQNEGRGGREERDGPRRGAATVLLLPGHLAGADTCQVLACACGERGEDAAAGAWWRLSRGDRVLAPRTPTSRSPTPESRETGDFLTWTRREK